MSRQCPDCLRSFERCTCGEVQPDFDFANHGSVTVLTPRSKAGIAWCEASLPEDAQRWAKGYVIEPRYAGDILQGITDDGLTVNTGD